MTRLDTIIKFNETLPTPSDDDVTYLADSYECETWGEFIVQLADEYNMPHQAAYDMFMRYGPDQAFNEFLIALESQHSD